MGGFIRGVTQVLRKSWAYLRKDVYAEGGGGGGGYRRRNKL